jgi:hypothetical protein
MVSSQGFYFKKSPTAMPAARPQATDFHAVNRQPVNSTTAFDRAVKAITGGKVLLLVRRGEASQYVVVQLAE